MTKRKAKILFPVFATAGVIAIVVPIVVISAKRTTYKENIKDKKIHEIDDINNIFPEIEYKEYYQYIKMDDGQPYFDEKIIPNLVKDVMKKSSFSNGKIQWTYELTNKQNLNIYFKYIDKDKEKFKTYKLSTFNKDPRLKKENQS